MLREGCNQVTFGGREKSCLISVDFRFMVLDIRRYARIIEEECGLEDDQTTSITRISVRAYPNVTLTIDSGEKAYYVFVA